MGGENRSRLRSKLESKMRSITVTLLLKFTVLVSAVLLFSGSLLFTVNNALSQEFGYASFITLVISSALLLLGLVLRSKKNVDENIAEETKLKDPFFSSFFLVNALAASLLIFISFRLVIFGDSLTGISNPSSVFNNLWIYPFNLISGYTGNGQGFIVQSFYPNLLSLIPMPSAE